MSTATTGLSPLSSFAWGSLFAAGCAGALASTSHCLLLGGAMLALGLHSYVELAHSREKVFIESNRMALAILGAGLLYAVCSWAAPIACVLGAVDSLFAGTWLSLPTWLSTGAIWMFAKWIDPIMFLLVASTMAVATAHCIYQWRSSHAASLRQQTRA